MSLSVFKILEIVLFVNKTTYIFAIYLSMGKKLAHALMSLDLSSIFDLSKISERFFKMK